jgi:lycopene cyclase domain-containing protein
MATRYFSKAYSSTAAVAAFVYLWFLVLKKVNYLNKFYLMYFISLFFFFIVNGILTALPVVMYNDFENSGIRLYTIPLEDTMYSFIMLLIPVSVYEYLKAKTDKQLST